MTQEDFETFHAMWNYTMMSYRKQVDHGAISYAFAILNKYPLDKVQNALIEYSRNPENRFAPTINEIIDIIENGDGGLQKNCEIAYQQVIEAMRRVGYMTGFDFKDKVIANTIERLGGWTYLCTNVGTKKTEESFRNEFRNEWKRTNEYKDRLQNKTFVVGASDDIAYLDNGRLFFTTCEQLSAAQPRIENQAEEMTEEQAKEFFRKTFNIIF